MTVNINTNLYNKNVSTTIKLAKICINLEINDRIPTYELLSKQINVARGTIQNSMKVLEENKAIKLVSKGHLGTFIIEKDFAKLLHFTNIKYVLGSMPLPYSAKFEGLCTGLVASLENNYGLTCNMTYMRDAVERIEMLLKDRCDFVVCSKNSANIAIAEGKNVAIALEFSEGSYMKAIGLVFHSSFNKEIKDGMKVGIVQNKSPLRDVVLNVVKGYDVQLVDIAQSEMIKELKKGSIDVTVWNKDELDNKIAINNFCEIKEINSDELVACIVIKKEKKEIYKLINTLIDINKVEKIQEKVVRGEMTPKY